MNKEMKRACWATFQSEQQMKGSRFEPELQIMCFANPFVQSLS